MKTTKQKLNVRLLRRVKRHILAEPKRLVMDMFCLKGKPGGRFFGDTSYQRFADCGTAACICGWANILTRGKIQSDIERARDLLGLDGTGWTLFDQYQWPAKFKNAYLASKTQPARAKIAAARIEHLIQTGE